MKHGKELATLLKKHNANLYITGGYIRDTLMGIKNSHDIDYAVAGISEEDFIKVLSDNKIAYKKTGLSFPVYQIEIDGKLSEVAFARREKKGLSPLSEKQNNPYRNFEIVFEPSTTIEEDLVRRDTTMNSMAYDIINDKLIDPFNGAEDIKNKVIRATSEHFVEDPVRTLRVARQAVQFGFDITPETYKYMEQTGKELAQESVRIMLELNKVLEDASIRLDKATPPNKLVGNLPSEFFSILQKANVLQYAFPEIYALIGKTQPEQYHPEGDAFVHTMEVFDKVCAETKNKSVMVAGLLHDIGKGRTPTEELPHHYKHEIQGLDALADMSERFGKSEFWWKWQKVSEFVIAEHMRIWSIKKNGKIVELVDKFNSSGMSVEGLLTILEADNNANTPIPKFVYNLGKYVQMFKDTRQKMMLEFLEIFEFEKRKVVRKGKVHEGKFLTRNQRSPEEKLAKMKKIEKKLQEDFSENLTV